MAEKITFLKGSNWNCFVSYRGDTVAGKAIQNIIWKESGIQSWPTKIPCRNALKTNVSKDNAWYLGRYAKLKWIRLLCKTVYTSSVCTEWTKKTTTVSSAQSYSFFEQWMLLQKMSGILAWNQMEHLWILSWTQVDKLLWGQKRW